MHIPEPPAPGVITELRCNEGTGTATADASGNTHNGTLTNGPTWGAGKYGQGINLDGANDYINIADHANFTLTPTVSYSWSAWVRNNNFNQWSTVWSQTVNTSNFFYFYTHTSNDAEAGPVTNGVSVYWYSGTSKLVIHSNNNVLTAGQWSYIAVTYDASLAQANRFTIYVNGVDVTNRTDVVSSGTIAAIDPTNTRIGSNQPWGEYLNGSVDEVRYYRRLLSSAEVQSDMNIGSISDTEAPTVNITAPVAGNVSTTINVNANAADNIGVTGVQFLLDGVNLGAEDVTAPYTVSWNTTTATNGSHNLTARARDAAGNITTSAVVAVNVANFDTEPPTVNITSPAAGNVSATINVNATATDNIGVAGVQFLLDGVNLGAEDIAAPYTVSWNTTTAANGSHNLTARARDAAGNTTTSVAVVVNVNNGDIVPPTVSITSPGAGNVSATISVDAAAADNIGVSGVQFLLDGVNLGAEDVTAPYTVSWNTTTTTNGNHSLTARARDAAGNTTTSAAITVNVSNPDITFPAVSITSPAAGNVSATINVNATATDNVGVVGVQFLLDGINLGAEDVLVPYSVSWNTTTVANGSHSLTARARDAAGNMTTSAAVSVNVNNFIDTEAPTVSITAPAAGNVSATINVNANAGDNVGVTGVQFLLDGVNLGAEDVAAPYSVSWVTTGATNGSHVLTARARDAAGNTTISAAVNVTVNNTNLVAAYGFNENTGTTATDNSGNNNNGTLTNGPAWSASGRYGSAILFDGTNDYININDANSLDLTNGMTLEAWVNPSNLTGFKTVICKDRTTSNYTYTLAANNNTTNVNNQRPNSRIRIGSNNRTVTGTTKLALNTWTHIASTYDGTTMRLYINGVQVSTFATTGNITVTTNPLRIGGTTALAAQYFAGRIDEVRIYNRALSQAEIQTDMNTPIAPDITNPVAAITAPVAGDVAGTINVSANASDNIAVSGVQFLLNGANLGAEDVSAPYSVSWNTTTVANGIYTLIARGRDAAGNTGTSAEVIVTVNNDIEQPTITLTAPAAGTIAGTVNVSADAADNIGVAGVQFLLNGANLGSEDLTFPYSVSWNTTTVIDGSYTLTARTRDAAGNVTTSSPVVVDVLNNPPDVQFPTVSITSPAAGDVLGTISVTADAGDNVGVAGVQFLIDGVNLGAEDISAPYSVNWSTTSTANGAHTLTARARDAAGNTTTSTAIIVNVSNDVEVPTVAITLPAAGIIAGSINIDADANDNIGVAGVQFLLNGVNLGTEDLLSPYSISWNTSTVVDGSYTLTARARDAAGNITVSASVVVNVLNHPPDTEPPVVNITSPAAGDILGTISITADATDNEGIIGVQFLLDGVNFGAEDITAPYSIPWNTLSVVNGTYTLTAKARDAAGYITTSTAVIVNVNNPPDTELPVVSITSPAAGNVSGTISITANASDNMGVVGVQFLMDGVAIGSEDLTLPYSVSWNTAGVSNGSHTLSARARDAAGNFENAVGVIVIVDNDIEGPSVSITAPAAGNVSGAINVTANASDNVGVTGVQFLLDGANLGSEDLTVPYSVSWNTLTAANGNHTLTARARDAAGNITVSSGVVVVVNNDLVAPTINITAPLAGNVSGTINVTANAGDNVGVTGVQFLLNGVNLSTEDLSAPYAISWNTATSPNGDYTLTARARDAAGNTTTSSPVNVTVSNITNLITALGFNEGTGTAAADVSGNNHHGTLTSGPVWAAGKYGQGINFDGSNDYVNIADHNNFTLDPAQSYTWSAWVKNNTFTEWSTVWAQTINTSNFFYFYAHTSTDPDGGPVTNGVSVYWWANNGASKLGAHSSNNVLTAGQWSHITITYNAGQPQNNRFTIYVNGVDVTVRTDVSSAGTITSLNPTSIRIGANQPFGEYLNGAVDEVRYYNKLLSPAEVVIDMNTPIGIDNTPPAVSISSPLGGNVSGTINVTANASDNFGVAGVQFLLDGVNLGAEDLTAPYTVPWNTETVTNGNHVLTARARDAAGNITVSTDVIVNVAPDFTATVTTPTKNVEVTGTTDFRLVVAYLNGFTSSSVALSFSGLPANATGHFLLNPMSHQGETQLFVTTNNATPGTYNFTMTATATAEGISHSQQATLVVTGATDFALTASPAIQNVTRGNGTAFTINLNETNDFTGAVALSVLGLPAGVTASFNPASPVPVATSILTINTTAAAPLGTYNLTVQGVSGAITRTIPITLTITDATSTWVVTTMGSTGVPNNTVRVGHLKDDGLERIYVGTISTGRMLEYSWNGTGWTGPVDVGGSPSGLEIHNCTIGPGRGDGKERMYIASYDFNIYEIWHDATGWHQLTVGNLGGNLGMHAVVGIGRNDGVTRLYAASTQQLYEFTWNGTSWDRLTVGNTPGAHELALGNGRMDGLNSIYIASISSGNFEARWTGTAWTIASMGDNGDARGLELGDGRNDGVIRVYSALFDGRIREFTWNGTAWTFINMPMAGTQNVHAYIVPGRNDGINRVYTCNANGKVFEYTWNGTTWDIYNMGGGSDYMYGLHYGTGRNDGVIRFYGADRGSVNRVYEFTWTAPSPLVFWRRKNETNYTASYKLRSELVR
ncbi:MAG TPA: Ig-like domain-containing protein [Chitinophagaceae bacterium]